MNEANKPAYPHPFSHDPDDFLAWPGLTKREYFAAHAPITVDDALRYWLAEGRDKVSFAAIAGVVAMMRVQYADALVQALERKPE